MTDLQSFAFAFALVWGGLAAYLVWLHALARRLEARATDLSGKRA